MTPGAAWSWPAKPTYHRRESSPEQPDGESDYEPGQRDPHREHHACTPWRQGSRYPRENGSGQPQVAPDAQRGYDECKQGQQDDDTDCLRALRLLRDSAGTSTLRHILVVSLFGDGLMSEALHCLSLGLAASVNEITPMFPYSAGGVLALSPLVIT